MDHIDQTAKATDDASDPLAEELWTIPMVVAWIGCRTEEKMRSWWNEPRTDRSLLAMQALGYQRGLPPIDVTVDELLRELRKGGVSARGLKGNSSVQTSMSDKDWKGIVREAEPAVGGGEEDFGDVWRTARGHHYRDVKIARVEVLAAWPPKDGAKPPNRGSRINDARALAKCRELIRKSGEVWGRQGLSPEWQAADEIGFADNPNDAKAARRATKRLSKKLREGKLA
jgi:hypothetical protein